MSKDMVSIPREELECLREHLNSAFEIFKGLGVDFGVSKEAPAQPNKKVSIKQGVDNYKRLLSSGKKRTLPAHLRTKKAAR